MNASDVIGIVNNATSTTYSFVTTPVIELDDYAGRQQYDVFVTTIANGQNNGLSAVNVFRIICYWLIFLFGFLGNLFVVILVIWKRNRKQVSLLSKHRSELSCNKNIYSSAVVVVVCCLRSSTVLRVLRGVQTKGGGE